MSEGAPDSAELLVQARALAEAGSYAGVVRLLEGVRREQLLGTPEMGYQLAYAWRRTGATAEALELCLELDVPVRRSAAEWLIRRRLNLEAMLRYDRGELAVAETLWSAVVEHASAADDQALLSAACNNLGVVHTLQDRIEPALAAYSRSLLAARRLGDRRGVAQSHQNLAILFRELSRREDADAHFRQALHEARAAASEDVRGRVEEERALLLLDGGDVRLAEATAQRALRRFAAIADVNGEGEALRVLGIISMRRRSHREARALLERALELAGRTHNALLRAETLEALAVLDRAEGDEVAASEKQAAAAASFTAMRAEPWGRRIRARTAELAAVS